MDKEKINDILKKHKLWLSCSPLALGIAAIAVGAYNGAMMAMTIIQKVKAWTTEMTIAQRALNLAMSLNPIGLVIAAIAALVAGFIYLWNTSESFRNFWINLWETIKTAASNVWDNIKAAADFVINGLKAGWEVFSGFLSSLWENIKNIVQVALQFIAEIISFGIELILAPWMFLWENCKNVIMTVWEWIKNIVSTAMNFIQNIIQTVMNVIHTVISTIWGAISAYINYQVNSITHTIPEIVFKQGRNAVKYFGNAEIKVEYQERGL